MQVKKLGGANGIEGTGMWQSAKGDPGVVRVLAETLAGGIEEIATELAQNARMAEAGKVNIQVDPNRVVFTDNGAGMRSSQCLLQAGAPGWEEGKVRREGPWGVGLFRLAAMAPVRIESKSDEGTGWTAWLEGKHFQGAPWEQRTVRAGEYPDLYDRGTEVRFLHRGGKDAVYPWQVALAYAARDAGLEVEGDEEAKSAAKSGWPGVPGIQIGARETEIGTYRTWEGSLREEPDTNAWGRHEHVGLASLREWADQSGEYPGRTWCTTLEVAPKAAFPRKGSANPLESEEVRKQAQKESAVALGEALRDVMPPPGLSTVQRRQMDQMAGQPGLYPEPVATLQLAGSGPQGLQWVRVKTEDRYRHVVRVPWHRMDARTRVQVEQMKITAHKSLVLVKEEPGFEGTGWYDEIPRLTEWTLAQCPVTREIVWKGVDSKGTGIEGRLRCVPAPDRKIAGKEDVEGFPAWFAPDTVEGLGNARMARILDLHYTSGVGQWDASAAWEERVWLGDEGPGIGGTQERGVDEIADKVRGIAEKSIDWIVEGGGGLVENDDVRSFMQIRDHFTGGDIAKVEAWDRALDEEGRQADTVREALGELYTYSVNETKVEEVAGKIAKALRA